MIVSALTFEAVAHGIADPGLRTLIAPLVTFLPGGVLTTATVELASGEMVAGASRLVFGGLQMLLLAFGIVAGAELAGLPRPDDAGRRPDQPARLVGALARRARCSASRQRSTSPRRAARCGWLLLVLLVAWVGQLVGEPAGRRGRQRRSSARS